MPFGLVGNHAACTLAGEGGANRVVIAFRTTPLDTGVMRCRGCGAVKPLSAFEPRADGKWGRRRRCRKCRQPVYRRYERKRHDRDCIALENRIATMPEGPQFDGLARNVLDRKQLRFVRALASRLKAGSYQLDAQGGAIIPPTLKPWADRLDHRQAESFCRHKLGLPRLPPQRRSPYPTFAEMARATLKRFRAEFRLKQRALRNENRNWNHRPAADPLEHDPWPGDDLWPGEFDERPAQASGGHGWSYEDERRLKAAAEYAARFDRSTHDVPDDPPVESRILEETYFDRVMAMPPPASSDYRSAPVATNRRMTNDEIISAVASGRLTIEEASAILVQLTPGLEHET
jgi:hypothetical protein